MAWEKLEQQQDNGRLMVAVWGEPKTGKTSFALSFPDPIYFFNMDWGLEHHIDRLKAEGRELYVANYLSVSPELTEAEAETMLMSFERDYATALKKGQGTIVIDTSTQLWQLVSKVFLDDIKKKRRDGQIYPFDYANANAYFQNLINQVKGNGMNMVLIQRAKEKYGPNGQPTGTYEIQGNNQVPYLMQVVLHLVKEGTGVATQHKGIIESCWQTSKVEGMELVNPSYPSISNLIHTMSETERRVAVAA